jgi:hypothetical protein
MAVRTGAAESEAAAKAQQYGRDRIKNLDLSDAEHGIIVRFLNDINAETGSQPPSAWYVVDTHSFCPTKTRPANVGKDGKWPEKMWAVCPLDQMFHDDAAMAASGDPEKIIYLDGFGWCYIHENYADVLDRFKHPHSRPDTQTFALVVLRERTDKGVRDKTDIITGKDGKDVTVPAIRLVQQQWKKFFSHVNAAAYEDGSVLCKDFVITKKGSEITVTPMSLTQNHHPAFKNHREWGDVGETPSWKVYQETLDLMGDQGSLMSILGNWASENWMKLWFWPGEWDEEGKSRGAIGGEDTESPDAGSAVAETAELDEEGQAEMAALRDRLLKNQAKK